MIVVVSPKATPLGASASVRPVKLVFLGGFLPSERRPERLPLDITQRRNWHRRQRHGKRVKCALCRQSDSLTIADGGRMLFREKLKYDEIQDDKIGPAAFHGRALGGRMHGGGGRTAQGNSRGGGAGRGVRRRSAAGANCRGGPRDARPGLCLGWRGLGLGRKP